METANVYLARPVRRAFSFVPRKSAALYVGHKASNARPDEYSSHAEEVSLVRFDAQ
jgi:hypothetical protein